MGEGVGKYSISYKEDTAFGATIVKKKMVTNKLKKQRKTFLSDLIN